MLTAKAKETLIELTSAKSGVSIVEYPIGCGASDVKILAPLYVPECKVAVLFIEPAMRDYYVMSYEKLRTDEKVPSIVFEHINKGHVVPGTPVLHIIAHSKINMEIGMEMLESVAPDVIMLDQDRFKNNARGHRMLRYMRKSPGTRLLAFSYPGANDLPTASAQQASL